LHQTVEVRNARFAGEIVHLVVEQEAGITADHARAEEFVDRVRHRTGVAETVDDRIVRRRRPLGQPTGTRSSRAENARIRES